MLTRRSFLKTTAIAGAGIAFYGGLPSEKAWAFYQTQSTPLWKTALRGVGPGGIPVAAADPFPAPITGVTHYTLGINQFTDTVHPTLGSTTFWGYQPAVPLGGGVQPQKHLGGIIVAQKGTPIQLTFTNNLPPTHIIPVDTSLGLSSACRRTIRCARSGRWWTRSWSSCPRSSRSSTPRSAGRRSRRRSCCGHSCCKSSTARAANGC
jgi:TAT (twin-arginine translocation) pathway signal sequence